MEMPEAKWLNWYSWFIIVASAIETGVFVSGGLLEKVTQSSFSCMTIMLGLVTSYFVIGGHFVFAKLTQPPQVEVRRDKAAPHIEASIQWKH